MEKVDSSGSYRLRLFLNLFLLSKGLCMFTGAVMDCTFRFFVCSEAIGILVALLLDERYLMDALGYCKRLPRITLAGAF